MATVQVCKPKPKPRTKPVRTLRKPRKRLDLRCKLKKSRHFILRKLRWLTGKVRLVLRRQQELNAEVNTLSLQVNTLGSQVNTIGAQVGALGTQVESLSAQTGRLGLQVTALDSRVGTVEVQIAQLRDRIDQLSDPFAGTRANLQNRIGSVVTIETDAGSLSGTLLAVGTDYAELLEQTGDLVLVRLIEINYIA